MMMIILIDKMEKGTMVYVRELRGRCWGIEADVKVYRGADVRWEDAKKSEVGAQRKVLQDERYE